MVQPAIDRLIDSLGVTIFRAVIEEMDWEAVNDDNDPSTFNWTYYNSVFSNARFQGVWNTLRYLNKKGITNGLIISLMGAPPSASPLTAKDPKKSWMGGTDYTISPTMEDEFVESIAALLYYARHTAKVQFKLVSPMNETDVISESKNADNPNGYVEGPNMPDAVQFVRVVGTSYHYLPSDIKAILNENFRNKIQTLYSKEDISVKPGKSWTTDAPYRETQSAIKAMIDDGADIVEMEASALYSLAIKKNAQIICFAHLTNTMAQTEGDFEKGSENGSIGSLQLIQKTIDLIRTI